MTLISDSLSAMGDGDATLSGGGEMGALIRAFDWSRTPVGPAASWPQSLRTSLSILLDARIPMYISWGPEFVEFYNDAFRPILGAKHPAAIGGSSVTTWPEIWTDFVGPLFDKVRTRGEATYLEDSLVALNRYGYMEECYFTFCYSAIREESGGVGGVLTTCIETTPRVIGERRLRTLRELGAASVEPGTPASVCADVATVLSANPYDIPFATIYLIEDDGRFARLAGSSGVSPGQPAAPHRVDLALQGASPWPLREVASWNRLTVVDDLRSRIDVPRGPWPEFPRAAAILPVRRTGDDGLAAFLIAGINARRPYDEESKSFLELVAGHLGRAIATARAHEEERASAEEKSRLLAESRAAKTELEIKAGEMQTAAAELEMQSEELRTMTDELLEVNRRLSLSEARLLLANTTAGIGTWELDAVTGTLHCDEQCRAVFGFTSPRLTEQRLVRTAQLEDEPRVREALRLARTRSDSGDSANFEFEYRLAGSGTNARWVCLTGRTMYGQDGQRGAVRIVGTVHEVTARRRAEEALREETQIVETIQRVGSALASKLELSSLVQTVTDEATKLTGAEFGAFFYNLVNDANESYTLYTISGVPREAFSKFPMPRNTEVFEPTFRGTGILRSDDITKDSRYGKNEPYFGMPKGHLPVVSYLAVPVVSRVGVVLGGLFFGHSQPAMFNERHERIAVGVAAWAALGIDNARLYDQERRARADAEGARAEAEKANHAKTEFLATMSHELRTPLNAIGGYVDLIDLGIRGPVTTAQREDLRRIQRSQQHLLSLINDILNFAKLEAGQVEVHLSRVGVARLLEEIEPLITPQLASKGLMYSCDGCGPDVSANTDEEKAKQILLNLLTNAVKFTDAGGRVDIRCSELASAIEITVSDTGRGISADRLDSIFEPFVQIDRHLTPTGHQGVGLGLAISRDLARAMGGNLEVASRVGEGSTFTLTLPKIS
jgi:signal transduction histidine kinase/PAS domain-containing protein